MNNARKQKGAALLIVLLIHFLVMLGIISAMSALVQTSHIQGLQLDRERSFTAAEQVLAQTEAQTLRWVKTLVSNPEKCNPRFCIPYIKTTQLPGQQTAAWWEDPSQKQVETVIMSDNSLSAKMVKEHLFSEFNQSEQWLQGYFRVTVRVVSNNTAVVTVLHSNIQIMKSGEQFFVKRLTWFWW